MIVNHKLIWCIADFHIHKMPVTLFTMSPNYTFTPKVNNFVFI